jgi:predicted aminopeptidase
VLHLIPTLLALIALPPVLGGCYLLKQGVGMLNSYGGAREIPAVLDDEGLAGRERDLLLAVQRIRSFALEELGLRGNDNYTRYKRIDKDYLVDVVSACEKTRFRAKTWRFPLFGSFPYKGYFRRDEALRAARRLEKQGYDVLVRRVQAFSTLGCLRDPVFSFMTGYTELELAELIIHEQAHATLFVKNDAGFNEQFATFVGRKGALLYLERAHGRGSEAYRGAVDALGDRDRFVELMHGLHRRLDRLYRGVLPDEEKLRRKQAIIDDFQEDLARTGRERFSTDAYRGAADMQINNALVLSVMRYTADLSLFERYYRATGENLPRMIRELRRAAREGGHPREAMRKTLEE